MEDPEADLNHGESGSLNDKFMSSSKKEERADFEKKEPRLQYLQLFNEMAASEKLLADTSQEKATNYQTVSGGEIPQSQQL